MKSCNTGEEKSVVSTSNWLNDTIHFRWPDNSTLFSYSIKIQIVSKPFIYFFALGGGSHLYPVFLQYNTMILQRPRRWEMPDSNPGHLPQKSGSLPMKHHISKWATTFPIVYVHCTIVQCTIVCTRKLLFVSFTFWCLSSCPPSRAKSETDLYRKTEKYIKHICIHCVGVQIFAYSISLQKSRFCTPLT